MRDTKLRSAKEWAELAAEALVSLRKEVWTAVNDAKDDLGGRRKPLSWQELVKLWRPQEEEDWRTVKQRWSRGLGADGIDVDVKAVAEVLEALQHVKERLVDGKTPRVRRLLHGERQPGERLLEMLYPNGVAGQDVSGICGCWRLVQSRSDGQAFIVWRLNISSALEADRGPGAWFQMDTMMPPRISGRSRGKEVAVQANGAVHAVGATFHLIGIDSDRRPVSASFELDSGLLPKDSFDIAQGLIQRVGIRGIYAARAIIRRVSQSEIVEIGNFTVNTAAQRGMEALADDIASLKAGPDGSDMLPYILADTSAMTREREI